MTHSHRWVEKRVGLNIFYEACRDCGAQSDDLPFEDDAWYSTPSETREAGEAS